jgi:Zn-finger nucleic acid-binding protein
MMLDESCPWCEEELQLPADSQLDAQTCPNCLTTWLFEAADPQGLTPAA